MKEYLETIKKTAEQNQTFNICDYYGKNGLLYCGECNTPKQFNAPIFGIVPVPCECQKKKNAEAEEKRKEKERLDLIAKRKNKAFFSDKLREMSFDKDDGTSEYTSKMLKYVEKFEEFKEEGKGLLLFGSTGTGKTFFACCIANALLDAGYKVKVTKFSRIANEIQATFEEKQAVLDSLNRYDLLVIDDFDAERDTSFMNEIVYDVIDGRNTARKPIIVTTNLTGAEMNSPQTKAQQRVISRILECSIPIEIKGNDRRRVSFAKSYAQEIRRLEV